MHVIDEKLSWLLGYINKMEKPKHSTSVAMFRKYKCTHTYEVL